MNGGMEETHLKPTFLLRDKVMAPREKSSSTCTGGGGGDPLVSKVLATHAWRPEIPTEKTGGVAQAGNSTAGEEEANFSGSMASHPHYISNPMSQ